MKQFYIQPYILDRERHFLLWYSDTDASDGVFTDLTNQIPVFKEIKNTRDYAISHQISNLSDIIAAPIKLDMIKTWLRKPRRTNIDCDHFLTAWNLFDEIALAVNDQNFGKKDENLKKIYDKIFWGNNLPSVTPSSRYYEPLWSRKEVDILRNLLSEGLRIFREHTVQE